MKNISRIFYSVIIATVVMIVFISASYAETVTSDEETLDCCKDSPYHPTTFTVAPMADTQLSVKVKGIKVTNPDESIEWITILHSDPEYKAWFRALVLDRTIPKEKKMALDGMTVTDVHITATCSSSTKSVDLWPSDRGRIPHTCKKGDGLVVELYDPSCDKDPDKQGVIIVTKKKDTADDGAATIF
ncbi:MAG: hypothetical protein A2V89_01510 [Gammaproteobacteria bacterium RBG_16_37_9]|nr:MAG: hypothetical protein A2V89_01510 [Gammaproteobacteria bacterium RBG_16_37_9]